MGGRVAIVGLQQAGVQLEAASWAVHTSAAGSSIRQ